MKGSILFAAEERSVPIDAAVFNDLKIDKILESINAKGSAVVDGLFRRKPTELEDVLFRLSCMGDLERVEVADGILEFLTGYEKYQEERGNSEMLSQRQPKQKWFLDAAVQYCDSVLSLRDNLACAGLRSQALGQFLGCLRQYATTDEFAALNEDAHQCAGQLAQIRYTVEIAMNQNKVTVMAEQACAPDTDDLLQDIARKFERYELSAPAWAVPFPGVNMGVLETAMLERLNVLFPETFALLEEFNRKHAAFDTALVDRFVEELQFYLCYLGFINRMRRLGYPFCYPCFSQEKVVRIEGGYDLALAQEEGVPVSAGDFLRDAGQSFLITGPNHGGKTTYACMVGQILYLASLGLPVPCRVLQTYFLSALYTHFAKAEDLSNNAGRLKEELQRLKAILDRLAEDSFVIFNDLFASTTTYDARQMGKQILERFAARGCLFLFVTSIGELAEDCPSLKVLCAAKEEGGSAYVVANGTGSLSSGRSRWAEQYRLRREDIQGRVGL